MPAYKVEFNLKVNLAEAIQANFDFKLHLNALSIVRLDADFVMRLADDYQSIVVDIHAPETPIDGAYT